MRIPIVAANWKMNKTPAEGVEFVEELLPKIEPFSGVERVICPAYVALPGVSAVLQGTPIKVGAQNVSQHDSGAYTGSVSAGMLRGLVEYVIIGHSEVREYQHDTNEIVNAKVKKALAAGLKVILAVGESRGQYEGGETTSFVSTQIRAAFDGIDAAQLANMVVAYEPIWAIGTGLVPRVDEADNIIKTAIRDTLETLYGADAANAMRIQYGGSVSPQIADFTALVQAAHEVKGAK
jgi:triosephosphate isomerase (TIM)